MIRVQQHLLEAARVPENIIRNVGQRTVALVDEFHLSIAALEDRNTLEHGSGRSVREPGEHDDRSGSAGKCTDTFLLCI